MAQTSLTVDLTRLRAIADRVERAADTIARFGVPGLREDDLVGSAVGAVASPALVTARLDDVVDRMRGWASAARTSAGAFEAAEEHSAARIAGS